MKKKEIQQMDNMSLLHLAIAMASEMTWKKPTKKLLKENEIVLKEITKRLDIDFEDFRKLPM